MVGTMPQEWWGLSPRVRGNPPRRWPSAPIPGSIPACAGEPKTRWVRPVRRAVYPRVCGGTEMPFVGVGPIEGLSPRVRGNHFTGRAAAGKVGSIPACAGEPDGFGFQSSGLRVYPRVCGGTGHEQQPFGDEPGLSPRVRGNHGHDAGADGGGGSIPACAGEPSRRSSGRRGTRVYPRVCGGTMGTTLEQTAEEGLSPRVRGNPGQVLDDAVVLGSIPACAGEPSRRSSGRRGTRVYPRVCGGTSGSSRRQRRPSGLSPRVRGNPRQALRQPLPQGVYPRVCGGTQGI